MSRSQLRAAAALLAISFNVTAPAAAQMAVADAPAESTLAAILSAISAGFTAVTVAITGVSTAVLSSSMTHTEAEGKLLTTHVQGLETFLTQSADAQVAAATWVRPPNACHFATAGLAQASAAAGVTAVNSALSNNNSVWMLGGSSATSGSGGVATSAALVANHLTRVASGGGAAPATVAAARQNGLIPPPPGQTDAADWAVAPSNLFAAPTLDPADTAANSWTVDLQHLLGDPAPQPMPNSQAANPETIRKALTAAAKQNAQELVLNQTIAERAPAAGNLQSWITAVYQQQGLPTSNIPANISWFQIHDTLVKDVLGGPQLDLYLAGTNAEGTLKEISLQHAESLQILWAIYQLLEKQGVQQGAAGAAQIAQNR